MPWGLGGNIRRVNIFRSSHAAALAWLCSGVLLLPLQPAAAQTTPGPVAAASAVDPEKRQAEIDRLNAESAKLATERDKLAEERTNLKANNEALQGWEWSRKILVALNSTGGAAAAVIGGLLGFVINRSYSRTQRQKIEQECHFERKKYIIELCDNLSDEKCGVRLAAASMLFQEMKALKRTVHLRRSTVEGEILALAQILVSAGKIKFKNKTEPMLTKYVADNLPQIMESRIAKQDHADADAWLHSLRHPFAASWSAWNRMRNRDASPLKGIDFQKAELADCYWNGINARNMDFFMANFNKSSLRKCDFHKAGFREAILENARLDESILTEAQLQFANLQNASLYKAKLGGANMESADLRGADLREADLTDAKLLRAHLDKARVHGATLLRTSFGNHPNGNVDTAADGEPPAWRPVHEWLASCSRLPDTRP